MPIRLIILILCASCEPLWAARAPIGISKLEDSGLVNRGAACGILLSTNLNPGRSLQIQDLPQATLEELMEGGFERNEICKIATFSDIRSASGYGKFSVFEVSGHTFLNIHGFEVMKVEPWETKAHQLDAEVISRSHIRGDAREVFTLFAQVVSKGAAPIYVSSGEYVEGARNSLGSEAVISAVNKFYRQLRSSYGENNFILIELIQSHPTYDILTSTDVALHPVSAGDVGAARLLTRSLKGFVWTAVVPNGYRYTVAFANFGNETENVSIQASSAPK